MTANDKTEVDREDSARPSFGKRLLFLLPVVIFLVIAGYFYWGLNPERDPSAVPTALIDEPVPDFALPPIEGMETGGLATADLTGSGEPVVLNVFASWCVPCRAEHPLLMRMAEEEGLAVYGLNYKDAPEDARKYLDELGNPYRKVGAMSDNEASVGIELGIYGVPETYIIDGDGVIRYKHVGPFDGKDLRETILPLMAELRG